MSTGHQTTQSYHLCSCGETFETTAALLEHAREEHGLYIH